MEIESILFSYLDAKRRREVIKAKLKMVEQELLPKSPVINGMPSSHNKTDKMADYMAKLEEVQKQYNDAIRRETDKMIEVQSIIDKVEDAILWQVLNYRYILGNSWKTIAEVMHYGEAQIFRLRKDALYEVAKNINDGK